MNITLIRPPAYSAGLMGAQLVPVLGIAYIASAARAAGHSVNVIDMCGEDIERTDIVHGRFVAYGMPFSAVEKRLKPSRVIGVTCMFSQDWVFHRELIRHLRRLSPGSIIVAGGEHISALPEYCLKDCPELDICVTGEGEDVFTRLLAALETGRDLAEVPGIVYREPDSVNYRQTPGKNRIADIDKLPMPAWDLFPMENYLSRGLSYHIKRGRTIPMLASRGCPYRCTFCSNYNMWGNPWIARDPKLIVDEIENYIKRYSVNNIVFSDLTAAVRKENITALCNEILKRRIDITWQLPTVRSEAMDCDVLKLMSKAGCRELDFAIESGSKSVLVSVQKGTNPKRMVSLIKDALSARMNLSVNIILGLPEEGMSEFIETYRLVLRLAFRGLQEVNVFPFVPYPGSKLFKEFLDDKRINLNDGYFLSLFGYADLAKAVSWSKKFGPGRLSFMRLFLFLSFYTTMFLSHPGRIVRLYINAVRGRTTTKLEGVLARVFRNVRVYAGGIRAAERKA